MIALNVIKLVLLYCWIFQNFSESNKGEAISNEFASPF